MVRGFHPLGELLPGQPSVDVMPLEELDRPLTFRVRDADARLLPVVIHIRCLLRSLSPSPRPLPAPWSMMALRVLASSSRGRLLGYALRSRYARSPTVSAPACP